MSKNPLDELRLPADWKAFVKAYKEHCENDGIHSAKPDRWIMLQGEFASDMPNCGEKIMWEIYLKASPLLPCERSLV